MTNNERKKAAAEEAERALRTLRYICKNHDQCDECPFDACCVAPWESFTDATIRKAAEIIAEHEKGREEEK